MLDHKEKTILGKKIVHMLLSLAFYTLVALSNTILTFERRSM